MISDYYEVSLGEFQQEFFESLPQTSEIVKPTMETEKFYHTVFIDGIPAGITGIVPSKFSSDVGFVQIVLAPNFRGKGLLNKIYNLLARRHSLKTLYATINIRNTISRKAHLRAGFKLLPEEDLIKLRGRGLLQSDEIRLIKEVT